MTAARFLLGVVLAALVVIPLGGASWALRRRYFTGWCGAPARLVELVIGLSMALVASELLGLIGLFGTAAAVALVAASGTLVWGLVGFAPGRVDASQAAPAMPAPVLGPAGSVVALAAIAVAGAGWVARTADAFRSGMHTIDTLWYHMPFAARFVQEGSIWDLHYTDQNPVVVFFPSNSPLLHALGVLVMGSDVLSPIVNLGWFALALVAAWCIGRPYGVAPLALLGVLVVLATPGLVATQPGGAYTDVVGLALLLSAVAVILNVEAVAKTTRRQRAAAAGVASLAAGMALGTKFTFLGPVAALTIGMVVLARRRERWSTAAVWTGGLVLTGGVWYVRNLVEVGNPLPSIGVHLGPLSLPSPPVHTPTGSMAQYFFDSFVWRQFFVPGFNRSLGPAWWAVLLLGLVAIAIAVLRGPRAIRMVGFVGVVSLVAFIVTKQFIGAPKLPFFFVYNVRYGTAAFAIGLVLLPIVAGVHRRTFAVAVVVMYALMIATMQLDGAIWPIELRHRPIHDPPHGLDVTVGIVAAATFLVAGLAWLRWARRLRSPGVLAFGTALVVLVVVAGPFLHAFYLRHRYLATPPMPHINAWARTVHDARIGINGPLTVQQYALAGKDLSNHVQFIGRRGRHGAFEPVQTCAQWRRLVNAGRYTYLVFEAATNAPPAGVWLWTERDDRATRVPVEDPGVLVYRVDGPLSVEGCRGLPALRS